MRVTDDAGLIVAVERPASRVVSLSPAFTEILFAIGAGDRVVGRTTWCDYPPAARAIPSVGDGLPPNVEAVAARRPDLVALYRSPATEAAARQLGALGIPTVLLRVDLLGDAARAARTLGVLTGRAQAGDSVARSLEGVASAAPPAAGASPRPRVAFLVWDQPPMVIGSGSYLHQLAQLAGADNVFGDLTAPSAEISLEALAQRNPDAIVVLSDPAELPRLRSPAWQAVPAVRARRIVYLKGSLYGRPSPRAAEAVAGFRAALDSSLGRAR